MISESELDDGKLPKHNLGRNLWKNRINKNFR